MAGLRIIPAYAGSTYRSRVSWAMDPDHPRIRGEHVSVATTQLARQDHPRIRGEHPEWRSRGDARGGSSPHTRGALRLTDWPLSSNRIIPAYAGSTAAEARKSHYLPDHPRIRGEHYSAPGFDSESAGIIPAGVHRHIDAFIDVEKHFSLPWRDFHGKVGRYGGA